MPLSRHAQQVLGSDATETQQGNLCRGCASNFNSIFTSKRFNLPVNYLSARETLASDLDCPLCQFFCSIFGPSAGGDLVYKLFAVSCLRYYALRFASPTFADPDIDDSNLWLILPQDHSSLGQKPAPESIKSIIRDRGCIALLDSNQDEPNNGERFQARMLNPDYIDFNILNDWLGFCEEHHKASCWTTESTLPHPFVVVDCETKTLVDLPEGEKFVALSYVWGAPSTAISTTSDTLQLPDDIPLGIQDAMTVVRKLGLRYIWIDRYCVSADSKVKHAQINNMDLVYKSAHCTIIAAAGQDPSYGLPGVSSRPRKPQPQVQVGSKTLVSILPHPGRAIRRSQWSSRAWTYQECLLSNRRLFFTSEQVYFECQSMHCCETVDEPLEALHTPDKTRFRMPIREGLFPLRGLGQRPGAVWARIEEYTQRTMTFDSDALNGMLGLLRTFSTLHNPVYHLWGVPFFKHYSKTDHRPRHFTKTFTISLCWRLVRPSKRRLGFPSWSWTGWKGPVCTRYEGMLVDRSFKVAENSSLWIENRNGNLCGWSEICQDIQVDANGITRRLSRFLTISALTISISFILHPTQSWTPKILRHRTKELADCNPFHLCKDPSSDPAFLERLETECFTGIIIADSQDRDRFPEHLVLVVDKTGSEEEEEGDAFERIGFFVADAEHIRRLPKWSKRLRIG